jgi:hypothetical protein
LATGVEEPSWSGWADPPRPGLIGIFASSSTQPTVIARQLGHKDASMIDRVYGRFIPDESTMW